MGTGLGLKDSRGSDRCGGPTDSCRKASQQQDEEMEEAACKCFWLRARL